MLKIIDSAFSNIAYKALAKAITVISQEDEYMQFLVSKLGNERDIVFKIMQFDTAAGITLKKSVGSNILTSTKQVNKIADITIISKCMDITYSLVFGTRSVIDCYNQQGFVAIGDVSKSTTIVNILSYVFAVLFSRKNYIDYYVENPKFTISRGKVIGKVLFGRVKDEKSNK